MKRKRLIIPAILFLAVSCSISAPEPKDNHTFKTEQLYKGYSKSGFYLCYLKILPGNRIVFTYQNQGNSSYGEHSGTIKSINDSTFHISSELTFGQFACKAPAPDTLSIFVDPPSLIDKKSILVQYENEELMTKPKITKAGLAFAFDDRLFNEYTPAYILTDHTHPITGEALKIKASFGSGYDFVQGDKVEFDIVISGDSLYTIGDDAVFQTGHFRLKNKKR